jgi:DNA-binding NarL/FixJ family response regulator
MHSSPGTEPHARAFVRGAMPMLSHVGQVQIGTGQTIEAAGMKSIRLLLVDDHPVMRAALANLLGFEQDFQIVGEADDGESALELWQEKQPDVCLLDVTMAGMDGFETLRRIRALSPTARVLMLTSSDSAEDMEHAVEAGAQGYLTKNVIYADLVAAIRDVHAGGRPIAKQLQQPEGGESNAGLLTRRELEVLGLLRQGFTNAEIGNLLGFSERTARSHVGAIKEKLHCAHRAEAVAKGFELGLLKFSSSARQKRS